MHNDALYAFWMDQQAFIAQVRRRMDEDGLTQRALAQWMGVSQGHLSKVLRGKFLRRSRAVRALEVYLNRGISAVPSVLAAQSSQERTLLETARMVSSGSNETMHLLIDLMRLVRKLRYSDTTL